jgi:hypothetical protein
MAAHPVTVMALASALCLLVTWLAAGRQLGPALWGMVGPLAAAAATWVVLERTHARSPNRVSAALIKLFAAKLLFFGVYVAAVAMLLPAGRIAFALSFTAQYVLLHGMEAWYLRRLLTGSSQALGR